VHKRTCAGITVWRFVDMRPVEAAGKHTYRDRLPLGSHLPWALLKVLANLPGSATARFQANAPPTSGSLDVSPLRGFALVTKFALSAAGWVDDTDDLPLTYSFLYTRRRVTFVLQKSSFQSTLREVYLPQVIYRAMISGIT
jgi:hypothetical protein